MEKKVTCHRIRSRPRLSGHMAQSEEENERTNAMVYGLLPARG